MDNLVINTSVTNSSSGVSFSDENRSTYSGTQTVNQTLVLKAGMQYSGTGFTMLAVNTDQPIQLVATKGSNPVYINLVINQGLSIDDSVDSFVLVNNGLVTASVKLLYTLNPDSQSSGSTSFGAQILTRVTVANLPSGAAIGQVAFALDGLKVGETTGSGTGVPVYYSNGAWRTFSTDAPVSA